MERSNQPKPGVSSTQQQVGGATETQLRSQRTQESQSRDQRSVQESQSRDQRSVQESQLRSQQRGHQSTMSSESNREIEQLRQRGLYQGAGSDRADRRTERQVEQYVKEEAPIVEEQIRRREIREVIPKIQREREVTEVRHAVLPIHDRVREQRTTSERELDEYQDRDYRVQPREEDVRRNQQIRERLSQGSRQELETEVEYRYAKPTVEEVIRPRIIHQIHPVVQREIEKEHYQREYLPIRERVIEGPRVADDVEVLRPLTRAEWEKSHGKELYERSGWQYGAPAEEFISREYVGRLDKGGRSSQYRSNSPGRDERRAHYSEDRGGSYEMGGMARALEPEHSSRFRDDQRSTSSGGHHLERGYDSVRRHQGHFTSGSGTGQTTSVRR